MKIKMNKLMIIILIPMLNCALIQRRHHQHAAYIEVQEEKVNTTVGKKVTLMCVVHNLKNYKIAWYHSGSLLTLDKLRIKEDSRYTVENPKNNQWMLIINDVNINDEGSYSCRLSNSLKRVISLKVGSAPKFIGHESSHHEVLIHVNENDNFTLTCEAYGNPQPIIKWYRNRQFLASGSELLIHKVTYHESNNEYECVAMNEIQPDASRRFTIHVNVKPVINHFNYTIETNEAENNLQILCDIFGSPINSIVWLKNGLSLNENDRANTQITITQISTHRKQSKLTLKNIDYSTNGQYTCIANGYQGETNQQSLIINDFTTTTTAKTTTFILTTIMQEMSNVIESNYEASSFGKHIYETNQIVAGREARSNLTSARVHSPNSSHMCKSTFVLATALILLLN